MMNYGTISRLETQQDQVPECKTITPTLAEILNINIAVIFCYVLAPLEEFLRTGEGF
jgi:hypothetical protein